MIELRDIDLIDELCSLPSETEWLEFKKDNFNPDSVGKRCSALSNAARIEGKDFAYMLWGIDDQSHDIIGTKFNPDAFKVGQQDFQLWLAQRLQPSIAFRFRSVEHQSGKVVILEVPAATVAPVSFDNIS